MTMILPNKDKDSFGTISPKSDDRGSALHIENEQYEATQSSKLKSQFAGNRSKSQDATKLSGGVLGQMLVKDETNENESLNMTSLAP